MTGLALLCALVLAFGFGLLRLLGVTRTVGALTLCGWAWILGAFGTSLVVLAWSAAGLVGRAPLLLQLTLALLALSCYVLGARRVDPLPVRAPHAAPRWEASLLALSLLLVISVFASQALELSRIPMLDGDETHFWALKAKKIFTAGGLGEDYRALVARRMHHSNFDYPPLNPLLQLLVFEQRGGITHAANRLLIILFVPALALSLAGAVARMSRPLVAALLLPAVLASNVMDMYAGRAMSDLIVAAAALGALETGLLARQDARWIRLTALFGATAIFAKHDGRLLLVAGLAATIAVLLFERERGDTTSRPPRAIRALFVRGPARRRTAWLLAPAAVVGIVARLNAAVDARNNFDGGEGDGSSLVERIVAQTPDNLAGVLEFLGERVVFSSRFAGFVPLAFLALLVLAPRAAFARDLRIATLALVFAGGGLVLVFCGLPHDLTWHLRTAGERVFYQLVPATAVWVAALGAQLAPALFRSRAPQA